MLLDDPARDREAQPGSAAPFVEPLERGRVRRRNRVDGFGFAEGKFRHRGAVELARDETQDQAIAGHDLAAQRGKQCGERRLQPGRIA